jgi:hypothetical protein
MSVYDADRDFVLAREPIVRRAGLGPVWDHLTSEDDTASRQLLLAVVSTLAVYMDESGLHLTHAASP